MSEQNFNVKYLLIGLLGLIIIFGIIIFVIPSSIFDIYFSPRLNLLMSFSIGLFVVIEALSTYRQWTDSQLNRQIDIIRDQLEKAFGPLYAQLTYIGDQVSYSGYETEPAKYVVEVNIYYPENVIQEVNRIFLKYPYMFEKKLYDFWQSKVRYSQVEEDANTLNYPEGFVEECLEAYHEKLKEYQSFLRARRRSRG